MHIAKRSTTLLALLALVFSAIPARAETVNCTPITSVPAVITAEGAYCLTASIGTNLATGTAIDIQTHNVVLDLNGFKLGNLAAGPGTNAFGIHAADRQNITIKNGTIRGFQRGIALQGAVLSQGHVVEDIRADQNTFVGIDVEGSGSIVRNNQVVATGGTTAFGGNVGAVGIQVLGEGPRVLNNDVIKTMKQGSGVAAGIQLQVGTGGLAVNNRITAADIGINYTSGATGKYRDNVTFDVTSPYVGGTDVGNNN